ncbi:MAG: TIGR02217 family protein, partial [Paracoccus sp. (in: a-proteobacteria)]|uniref:phage distal tail protein, Rcc01695 family n=1 Tax=Paracoccus sp. TaxID=267 RepID=UPI0039196EFD
ERFYNPRRRHSKLGYLSPMEFETRAMLAEPAVHETGGRPFFEARNGRLHSFRFKDWGDHKSCLPSGTPSPNDQAIGTGDGRTTAFQLVKHYASGAQSWTRAIAKPVTGTVRIALGGIEQLSGWSVDTATGVVTFSAAPGSGLAITAGFEFDVPVRFDTDVLDVTLDLERLGSITSIPLLELRR